MAVRVLWVIKGLGPGGAEHLLRGLAGAHHPQVVHAECAFVVPWKTHLVPDLEARGVPCTCLSRRRHDLVWPLRLWRLVRRGRFDVVHVHSPLPGSVARLAARSMPVSRRPAVFTTEHNAWGTFRLPTRWFNRLTNRADRHTFAVSAEVAGSLRGPVVERSAVLIHGVDLDAVRAARSHRHIVRGELGIGPEEVVAVTVANFREQKDYPTLLRAWAALRAQGGAHRLLVVGQGPLEQEVRALHAELGLDGSVVLLGYRADAVDVVAAADVFVLVSRWEGLPVALMEACAVGLACVLTDVGGMRDALGDDGACWVQPGQPADLAAALGGVLADGALRARLASAAAAAADQFDISRAAREIERRYVPPVPTWNPPVGLDGLEIRRAVPADETEAVELCRTVLGHADDAEWAALFRWKHRENPVGASPMWVAVHDGRIVGVRVFMRWRFVRDGREVQAVRAVDTATHPGYQGKGLFTALTLQGLAELQAEGVPMVFNTPNSQSRPGYLKMGWELVGRLTPVLAVRSPFVIARVRHSRVPASLFPDALSIGVGIDGWLDGGGLDRYPRQAGQGIATDWSPDMLRWRFGSATQPCRVVDDGRAAVVVERRRRGEVNELVCLLAWGPQQAVDRLLRRTMRTAGADVVLRLGRARPHAGFVRVPGAGPTLTCRALTPDPVPGLHAWQLDLGSVVLF